MNTFALAYEFIPVAGRRDVIADPDRNLLYIANGTNGVLRYDLIHKTFLAPFNVPGDLWAMDLSPDHTHLALADVSYTDIDNGSTHTITSGFYLLDLETGTSVRHTFTHDDLEPPRGEVGTRSVSYTNNDTLLVTAGSLTEGTKLRQFSLQTHNLSEIANVGRSTFLAANGPRTAVGLAEPSGQFAIYTSATQSLTRSITSTNQHNVTFLSGGTSSGAGDALNGVALRSDGKQIALDGNLSLSVFALNLEATPQYTQLARIVKAPDGSIGHPLGLTYSPDGEELYVAWDNFTIGVYKTDSFQLLRSWSASRNFLDFNIGGGRLRTSDDGSILYATVNGGVEVYVLPEPAPVSVAVGVASILLLIRRRTVTTCGGVPR